jgi:hypothetical protein
MKPYLNIVWVICGSWDSSVNTQRCHVLEDLEIEVLIFSTASKSVVYYLSL